MEAVYCQHVDSNDGPLENVSPASNMAILGIYVRFEGGSSWLNQPCASHKKDHFHRTNWGENSKKC